MKQNTDQGTRPPESESAGERLQKVLAAAGLGSRRECEELIRQGRVEVDRQVVTELGTRVDPLRHEIRVDGQPLRRPKRLYYAVNKPVGVVSTSRDPSGRPRVIDLVPTEERVFAVGRLDRSSEGLILVTNDGDFANRITHPRFGVEKTYLVRVAGAPSQRELARLKKGVHLAEGFARAQSIRIKGKHGKSTDLIVVLNEGRNREIRRILARVGHKVLALKRIAIGPIRLGDLPPGGWRKLTGEEVESLLRLAKEKRRAVRRKPKVRGPKSKLEAAGMVPEQRPGTPDEEQYVQKKALLAEPLSLDELLRDDLDEGPISPEDMEPAEEETGGRARASGRHGRVIDYERRPREDFGRKRGGKRLLGPPEEGRGPAGAKAGKYRFLRKKQKPSGKRGGKRKRRR